MDSPVKTKRTESRIPALTTRRIQPRVGIAIVAGLLVFNLAYWFIPWGASADSERIRVWGNVTVDGQRLEVGRINFVPNEGDGPSTGGEIRNGRFDIPRSRGPSEGLYTIFVHQPPTEKPIRPDPANFEPAKKFPRVVREVKEGQPLNIELTNCDRQE